MTLSEALHALDEFVASGELDNGAETVFMRSFLTSLDAENLPLPEFYPQQPNSILTSWEERSGKYVAVMGIDGEAPDYITFIHDTTIGTELEGVDGLYGGYSRTTADFTDVKSAVNAIRDWYELQA